MRKAILVLVILFSTEGFGLAGPSQDSWDNLKQLQPGQKIEVVDNGMRAVQGAFVSISEEAITVQQGDRQTTVQRPEVFRVSLRDGSHRRRNMLMGAGIGVGAGLALALPVNAIASNEGSGSSAGVVGVAALFGGVGAGLGAIPGGNRVIYRVTRATAEAGR